MKILTSMVIGVLALGCKGESAKQSSSDPAPKVTAACPQQTAELKTWIQDLFAAKPLAAPWPTGDAALDAELTKWRDRVRTSSNVADPSETRVQLEESKDRKPGILEQTFAGCEPGKAQLAKVGAADPANQPAEWAALADAIAACDCKPSVAAVKASLFVMIRGADGEITPGAPSAGAGSATGSAAPTAEPGSATGSAAPQP